MVMIETRYEKARENKHCFNFNDSKVLVNIHNKQYGWLNLALFLIITLLNKCPVFFNFSRLVKSVLDCNKVHFLLVFINY